jgi:hypothetical protein
MRAKVFIGAVPPDTAGTSLWFPHPSFTPLLFRRFLGTSREICPSQLVVYQHVAKEHHYIPPTCINVASLGAGDRHGNSFF